MTEMGVEDQDFRIEHDTMGEVRVPVRALWQAQTQRAVENFPISGVPIDPALVAALGLIKGAAAQTNARLGRLSEERAAALRTSPGQSPRCSSMKPVEQPTVRCGDMRGVQGATSAGTIAARRLPLGSEGPTA